MIKILILYKAIIKLGQCFATLYYDYMKTTGLMISSPKLPATRITSEVLINISLIYWLSVNYLEMKLSTKMLFLPLSLIPPSHFDLSLHSFLFIRI